jgi:hypothetical protein
MVLPFVLFARHLARAEYLADKPGQIAHLI